MENFFSKILEKTIKHGFVLRGIGCAFGLVKYNRGPKTYWVVTGKMGSKSWGKIIWE